MIGCNNGTTAATDMTCTGLVWKVWIASNSSGVSNTVPFIWNNRNYQTTADTAYSPSNVVWGKWQGTGDDMIDCWNRRTCSSINKFCSSVSVFQTPPETAEEWGDRLVEAAERQARKFATEKKQREDALQRAQELLLSLLDEEQAKMFMEKRQFHVVSQEGNRYEIDCTRREHNVFELQGTKRVREYCIVQTGSTPLFDSILAQKLMLEMDEKSFHRIANRWNLNQAGDRMPA